MRSLGRTLPQREHPKRNYLRAGERTQPGVSSTCLAHRVLSVVPSATEAGTWGQAPEMPAVGSWGQEDGNSKVVGDSEASLRLAWAMQDQSTDDL